jgi:hypothetical protein
MCYPWPDAWLLLLCGSCLHGCNVLGVWDCAQCLDKLHKADRCAGWWLSVQCQIRLRARGEVHCDGGKRCVISKKEKNAQCCTGKLSLNSRMDLWFTSLRNVEQHAFEKNQNLLDIFCGPIFASERQWLVMAMVFAHHILFSGVTYFCMLAKK